MDKIVNIKLLKNPLNWVIVALMVAFGAIALTFIDKLQPQSPE